ncbi:MAG: amidohydrolase family protein [Phycisphaerales bacterium]
MSQRVSAHNTLSLDFRAEAGRLGPPVVPIIDAHSHIHGAEASRLYDRARKLFGVTRTYSMTQLAMAPRVAESLGESIRFIAIPSWAESDRHASHGRGYLKTIERFHAELGSRMLKLWASPRLRDLVPEFAAPGGAFGATDLVEIDSPARIAHCELGQKLGMMFMVHVADPDTWFATQYRDPARYGTKADQYAGLERMLDRFASPWIAAHMGGWPEDLAFLSGLLERHPNLHLDTSATKWIVRELSLHRREDVVAFFTRWRSRLIFGSDLVVMEDQLSPAKSQQGKMADLASSPEQAFELYCSRYWALRTMFETDYDGPSTIADPDLMLVDPAKYGELSSPRLRGLSLPPDLLADLYRGNAERLIERWWVEHA